MGAQTFVKFCKIGALSATGTRPYAEGADGFVMGEGAAIFLLKRLADAERDGDKIYAVIRGMGGASDGKGKGITAPNPVGQRLAIERGWQNAGLSPSTVTLMEGHGTSTRVGDVVEVQSMIDVLGNGTNLPPGSVALGSVKSNIGHLKAAAGAAGILKTTLALHHKMLPPSLSFKRPNPDLDFAHCPLYVNTELKPWNATSEGVRRAGVSAFGFGGTNFHAVLEEYIPHRLNGGNGKKHVAQALMPAASTLLSTQTKSAKAPLRGALVVGDLTPKALADRLQQVQKSAAAGQAPPPTAPAESDLRAPERIAIDYADAAELADKSAKALKALATDKPPAWKALRAQGIFRGHGPAPKVAFLYTGQGSQYVNMLRPLCDAEPIVAETFAEADRIMTPILGKPLSQYIFVDAADKKAVAKADEDLRQTAITQPAVLATDTALTRLLAAYGIQPDMTMGHSLGEYGALIASGAMPFSDALEAVAARGREMTRFSTADNGRMAAVMAPLTEIERLLKTIDGYVVVANNNSQNRAVIGGASKAVEQAIEAFQKAGYDAVPLPVSHAFHTSIVAPASQPLRSVLERLHLESPKVPIVANVNGEFYPTGPNVVPQMLDILAEQVAAPVQFIKGLQTLYAAGARVFVETGPKKALQGFAEDVLGGNGDIISLFTNHPKAGDIVSFNQALCGLYAWGFGQPAQPVAQAVSPVITSSDNPPVAALGHTPDYNALGHMFADVLERGWQHYGGGPAPAGDTRPVMITGAALGLPGTEHIFDDTNIARILRGEQCIDVIPKKYRNAMLDKHIRRLVKSDNGGPVFETLTTPADMIKLAGRGGAFNLETEFGVSADRVAALDRVTRLAIAVGLDALRDAGIPLVMRYKTTSKGTQLPDRWGLPEAMRDDTGIIMASAFPGYDSFADEMARYYADHERREELSTLESLRARITEAQSTAALEIDRRIAEVRDTIEKNPYVFERRFLLRTLSMGHSQFAEFIGARGPNTQINAACASTSQGISIAEDWIRAGRCRRVIIISADDVTSDHLIEWMGAGFLASGAAATDEVVEEAATPFDKRRHGLIMGMGAASLVVESAEAARERGIQPICEVLSTITANSAFHGTRLDVQHIGGLMETLIAKAEKHSGIERHQIAPKTVFVSHETYTPARGGSASAEINALRKVFGQSADQIVIANTKGFTGHAMATGIEEVVAVKALETGCVPPVANFKEVDPELGVLNLSKGGTYPVEYALRLGAGFGSQISLTLLHWVTQSKTAVRPSPNALGYAYRIVDQAAWSAWLTKMVGKPSAALEVVNRTLRVKDVAQAVMPAAPAVLPAKLTPKPEPKPMAAPPPPPPKTTDAVQERLLALVAEKTGYPADMLELDLDLEADLGVDTVKQADLFASIREIYNIPRDPNLKLREFPTLARVIQFVHDRRPDLVAQALVPAAPALLPAQLISPTEDPVKTRLVALVAEKTGYPADMLELDLDLEADLGVDTVKQADLFASIREIYDIPRDPNLKLREFPTLGHVIQFVHDRRPDLVAQALMPAAPALLPAQPTPSTEDPVKSRLVALVAEKTGYPSDMLDLDLDLEADLGVDTVKQADLFASIREIYDIPRDPNMKLRDFPTLAHVIQFVHDRRPDLVAQALMPAAPALLPAQTNLVKERLVALVAEKTGYPADMLDLDLDLEADLGVDTVKQADLFASIREIYGIPRDPNLKLREFPTLAHVIQFVHDRRPDLVAQPVAQAFVPAAPAVLPASPEDPVKERLVALVAEKTGYPADMLDLDLDLEADLGVDTVKQADLFASIREIYGIPRDPNLKLREFPTLGHVIQFVHDRMPAAAVEAAPALLPVQTVKQRPAAASLDAANAIPRRVPVPVVRPALDLCKTTGVTLGPGSRVLVMADKGGVAEALTQQLQPMGVEILTEIPADGQVQGVFWLPALDYEGPLNEMDLAAWREALRVRVKAFFTTMRTLYEQVSKPGTFLVSATRLGGQHGYGDTAAYAPLGGAVAGFTKTYKRERPEAFVKVVDFEAQRPAAEVAATLIVETLRDPGAVEIGYQDGRRFSVALQEQPAADGQPGMTFTKDTVFVVTGAAGSIVSAITSDLASASGGTFYLLDLVPEPDPANLDIERFVTDKEGLKRDLHARIKASGKRATPALVDKELAGLERAYAAKSAIDAVKAAGGTAYYFSVNMTDAAAVAKAIDQVRERSGHIDVLLHAAGIERSHFLPDKDPKEFDLVFDVKSDGWFNLLHAIGDMPLGATVAFSSIAGRFGNGGQTDYSAANDLLCKISSSFRATKPATRGIAIDWTAWGGIGMATRGSIPESMAAAGIDMLPPEAGVPMIRRELTLGGTRGEVVVAKRLGILQNEWDATGGLDTAALEVATGPMIGKIVGFGLRDGLVIETTLTPAEQPFLNHHRIDGKPVLPGVMGIEAFAETALRLFPGWYIQAVEDVNFMAPFKFYRDESRAVTVQAVFYPQGDSVVAECRLTGQRTMPNQAEPQITTHFTAKVRLSKAAPEAVTTQAPGAPGESVISAGDIYRAYFHGPAYQVMAKAWREGNHVVGEYNLGLPPNHQPSDLPLAIAPRLIEFCFQTAGIWEMGVEGQMGLPLHIDQVSLLRAPEAATPLFAVATPDHGAFNASVVDAAGNCYLILKGYRTMVYPDGVDAEPLQLLQAVMQEHELVPA